MAKYKGEYTREISYPLGGIGTGSIGLGGSGNLIDWEVFNRPNKGSINGYSHIAVRSVCDGEVTSAKVLCGDWQGDYTGQYNRNFGLGPSSNTMCGFPHFEEHEFVGEFPVARINFKDKKFPARVSLEAFNPFIPMDAENSSLPAAFFKVEFENTTDKTITYSAAFSVKNPFEKSKNIYTNQDDVPMVSLINDIDQQSVDYGDLSIATYGEVSYQQYWYRGGWSDHVVMFWNDFSTCLKLENRVYETEYGKNDTATIMADVTLEPGEKKAVKFVLTWNMPNNFNYWSEFGKENGKPIIWKNYYATKFASSKESALYCMKNYDSLYERTLKFKDVLYSSTLPECVKDAAFSTMSVLKTATVLRLEDGSFYGWEGMYEKDGSCEGTCQHVYNYAYALCFLFPELERSIRDLEFEYSTDDDGKTVFRLSLPLGANYNKFRACLDGQMGCIIKSWREWKISGDDEWLRGKYDKLKLILDYATSDKNPDRWDADCDGVLEGRQHHTLDMELFGPSAWLEGMYLAALRAFADMAQYFGDKESYEKYTSRFNMGKKWMDENLFNGSYYFQKIDLKDKAITDSFDASDTYFNEESGEIKYQIGEGCSIDQLCGQWHANILGLGDIFDADKRKTALINMYKNNFKPSMRDFYNPWRIFALNDESGAIICDYPEDVYKPVIPIPYCEESMHGFEYELAGLLVSEGFINEGIEIVKSVRDRYDGKKRNPYNEIECGSNYARSMASFALLPIFSGFVFDMPNKTIGFAPKVNKTDFSCFFAVGKAWGRYVQKESFAKIELCEGGLQLQRLCLPQLEADSVVIDGVQTEFTNKDGYITFNEVTIEEYIEIKSKKAV